MCASVNYNNPFVLLRSFQKNPYYFFDQVKPVNSRQIRELRLGFGLFYFCYHPDHAKHILQDNRKNYPKSSLVLKKILPLSGPQGLIQLNDSDAKIVRQSAGRLMNSVRAQVLSKYVESFVQEEFENLDVAAEQNLVIDLKAFLTQLVLRTAGIFILGEDIQSKTKKLNKSFVKLNRMAGDSLRSSISCPFSFSQSYHLKVIHVELDKIIKEALQKDNTSLLYELHNKNLNRSFIRDQIKAFMFAGYDTTASSLIFAVDSIARDKNAQEQIFSERHLNYRSALFTQAAYKESLRLYPSAYFLPRQVTEDDFILEQKVKTKSQIFISIRHVQRDPEIYKNPDQFIPERFLEKPAHSHAFIPFGGGPRICIGASLAMMEATVVLQNIFARYEIEPVNKTPPEIEGLITAHINSPLNVRLKRRKK